MSLGMLFVAWTMSLWGLSVRTADIALNESLPLISTQCFEVRPIVDQPLTCLLSLAGNYPEKRAVVRRGRCCFLTREGRGLVWVLGESVMSQILGIELPGWKGLGNAQHNRVMVYPARLLDLLVLDVKNDAPIEAVRVTMASDALHLLAFRRYTDADGYAVLPMLPGQPYTLTLRASGYVQPTPFVVEIPLDEEEEFPQIIVTLDPGVRLAGRVTDERGRPVPGARLRVRVSTSEGVDFWDSTLDLPKPIRARVNDRWITAWLPKRPTFSADDKGRFLLHTIPRGLIELYAESETQIPAEILRIDAREDDAFMALEPIVTSGQGAWIRVEDERGVALEAQIVVTDLRTRHMVSQRRIEGRGAARFNNLPQQAQFEVFAQGYAPLRVQRTVQPNDEIILTLDTQLTGFRGQLTDKRGQAVASARITALSAEFALCHAKTDARGQFLLENCPATGVWVEARDARFAPKRFHLSEPTPQTWVMDEGKKLSIEVQDASLKSLIEAASCTITTAHDESRTPWVDSFNLTQGTITLEQRPNLPQQLRCRAKGYAPAEASFDGTRDAELVLLLKPMVAKHGVVVDSFGAPVAYAQIEAQGERFETDEIGRFHIESGADGDLPANAWHWEHGRGQGSLKPNTENVIRLNDLPNAECEKALQHEGIRTITDSAVLLVDAPAGTWQRAGLQRGDAVEHCTPTQMDIVRNGRRITLRR
ncbi:MAG: carboxypeptidase regulatory-like domain-containing protein [Proteobacteria bacterium]|nr:carboxypeptidase regulatory-like domain-containing protein [Pseudomonadota bacterium]